MRHDRRIAFLCDMSHKRINESDNTGLKGKTKERRSPGCSQTHGLAQAESAILTEGRRCPRETLFSHHVRLVAELGRRPSIPSPTHGRDSGKISKRPSDGTARSEYPEMEAIKLFAKVRVYVAQPEHFFEHCSEVTGPGSSMAGRSAK